MADTTQSGQVANYVQQDNTPVLGRTVERTGTAIGTTSLTGPSTGGAAPTATGHDEAGALAHQVGELRAVLVVDDGALGHVQDQVLAAGTVAVVALARATGGGLRVRTVVEVQQGGHPTVPLEDDVAPVSALATGGDAGRPKPWATR